MKKRLLVFGALPTLSVFCAAHAQTVDYNALETLVGQPVTVSATGTPQRVQDVAANVTIITADQIRQSGSRDIPEILSRVPGLDVVQEGIHTFDVGVRGYQQAMQPRLLVLIDGRQVFSDDYSRTIWENLPVNIDDIRQIEVIKGPGSALFGSNAAGGVINIITYNPLFDKNNVAAASYGTQNRLTGDATVTAKPSSDTGVKFSAGGLEGTEFNSSRAANEAAVTRDPLHEYVAASSVSQVTPTLIADTEATYSRSAGTESYYNGYLAGVDAETYSGRAGFSWQTPYGTIKSNNYVNHSTVQNNEVSISLPNYADVSTLYVTQLEDQFSLGKDHTFRLFGEYQHKAFHLNATESDDVNTDVNENNFALGGMWRWQISDKLSWTNALREDHLGLGLTGQLYAYDPFNTTSYDHSLDEWSANSGIVYQATGNDTFRLIYGRGIEMPSLLDYGFNSINRAAGIGAVERIGNPELDATVVSNYEADYDRKINSLYSTAKFSVYYETNANVIAPFAIVAPSVITSVSPTTKVRESFNAGSSQGLGGEFELEGHNPQGFRWDASYSYAKASDNTLLQQDLGYQNSTPLHHFRILGGYTSGPWEFDVNAQYLTSRFLYRNYTAPAESGDYLSLGGRVGYTVSPGAILSLSGTDLTQAETQESPYPAVERQVLLQMQVRF